MGEPDGVDELLGHVPFADGLPEPWMSDYGQDEFGLYADLVVRGVRQRMRWIPWGRFRMGSPEAEAGRYENETPHDVELTRGYWMGDTPCTQELWTAIVGSNPSRFPSPQRPVEQVAWTDVVDTFMHALNEAAPGFAGRLPTEAEWERACRAGTTTATYAGDLLFKGENNVPILDGIGWYTGNCGRDFDLQGKGYYIKSIPEKQFNDGEGGTRVVGKKAPNAYGLYDMIGNVWEWCSDRFGDYDVRTDGEALIDPLGSQEGGGRVIRGGSWGSGARFCRAACRGGGSPEYRNGNLGFRLARG